MTATASSARPWDAERVARWLRDNTYHHSRFADLDRLVRLKREQGRTVSLCLPTLNEERTIGKEILLLRAELMQRHPLLDEIVVMDSGSTDHTREIAAEWGARVCLASEVLPGVESRRGKGENLWKALYQCEGDIIVYVDADIRNVHPRFAYALLGPLLERPDIEYVKAFYDRPIEVVPGVRTSGGGRVTELLVRPMFSLFVPELAALIQPLSGEYAARRSMLETLPFPIGYGVEVAHLLDIYHRRGLDALAQVDLDQRVHRNQPLDALGRMAFGILQVMFDRLHRYGHLAQRPPISSVMRQFSVHGEGGYQPVEYRLAEEERPPIITVPEYRARFGRPPPTPSEP